MAFRNTSLMTLYGSLLMIPFYTLKRNVLLKDFLMLGSMMAQNFYLLLYTARNFVSFQTELNAFKFSAKMVSTNT